MMNTCQFVGRLVRDPFVRDVGDTQVCNITLALNRRYKKQNGEMGEQTTYLDFEAWDSGARVLSENFAKGDWIVIPQAEAKSRLVEDEQSGKKYNVTTFRINRFDFPQWSSGNGKGTKSESPAENQSNVNTGGDDGDEEVPF